MHSWLGYDDFIRDQFLRPLNWRWNLARRLAKEDCFRPSVQDRIVCAVERYIAKLELPVAEKARTQQERMLQVAHGLRYKPAYSDLRLEVEARILGRQSDQVIEMATSLPASAVGLFESVFFHVRDRLQNREWIRINALGGKMRCLGERTDDEVLLFHAYFGPITDLPQLLALRRSENLSLATRIEQESRGMGLRLNQEHSAGIAAREIADCVSSKPPEETDQCPDVEEYPSRRKAG